MVISLSLGKEEILLVILKNNSVLALSQQEKIFGIDWCDQERRIKVLYWRLKKAFVDLLNSSASYLVVIVRGKG